MDWNKPDSPPAKTPDDRPLPRGLEDVSHLFLSRAQQRRPAPDVAPQQPAPTGEAGLTVVLHSCSLPSCEPLVALLQRQPGALEEGLRVIDTNVPCEHIGPIEAVALSSGGQLTIIDVDDGPSEQLLFRAMGHFDWMVRNLANVRRMYQGHSINYSFQPRIFLIARDFSVGFRSVARQIESIQIQCVRYHAVALAGGTGILFERA
jgi:hypothetical protein